METVSHYGRTTAYRESDRGGSGSPLLFVHGSGGSHAVWRSQFRLADDHPITTLDLSGHGESDDVDANAGYETLSAYADDVIAVADATDARILAGNSLGGAVALHVALERTDEIDLDGLILAGTGARLAVLESLREWLAEDFDRAIEFLHAPGRLFVDPSPELVDASETVMRETGRAVTERDFLTCHEFDVRDRLDEIDVPTLAIAGGGDQLTPPRYHDYLASEIPDAALAILENAGHLAMLEQPEAFNTAIYRFVTDLDR
ncbi:hydrolase or acyltransferase of alpha/beta superfamily protein [Salinarchaeum sp. Harcht-Bsk1]|uniref:alpha/beta fold hydrolase n=1 Tax=Salinarchaeum sp. Harcht-Bsk1 TaxID=1333523 RepID=UPI0003423DE5|nr:alpha/beta hydrolase [Salinarchaeum sp. Harcht-Bsk1]AGN00973.1 hydrolase or acyltransferase of alpha/beta superfamily protein [Salinarchaeum sp. Harcht-Bsk1]